MNLIHEYIISIWGLMNEMSPYLLLGFIVSGILSVMVSPDFIEDKLGRSRGISSVFLASFIGIPLPLCSCGVLPLAASLKRHGASKGACSSFLLSTPQTGVDSILVTYNLFNPVIAIIRPIIALITGLVCGMAVHMSCKNDIEDTEHCKESCCAHTQESILKKIFKYGLITLPKDIAKPLMIGILLSGVIAIAIPNDLLTNYLGGGIVSMIIMVVCGLPLYVCATASIPLALVLISKGASLGAAMVFLMTGPATNTTSLTTMAQILGKRGMMVTIFSLCAVSISFGMIIDLFDFNSSQFVTIGSHFHEHNQGYFKNICSLVLIAVMINCIRKK